MYKEVRSMKSTVNYLWKVLVAVFVLDIIIILGMPFDLEKNLANLSWLSLSNLLIILVLTYAIVRSAGFGWKLSAACFLLFFGISTFNTNIEAVFFQLNIPRNEAVMGMVGGGVMAIISSFFLVFILGKLKKPADGSKPPAKPKTSLKGYLWKFPLGAFSYAICYIVAGILVFPYIREFYAQLSVPNPNQIILMQLLLRGPVYIIVCLPIIRMMKGGRWETALMVGLLLSILGGVAPLLIPDNPYMPGHIRLAHGIEIGISNFVFGAIIGYLFGTRRATTAEKT
jgi:hypothetical protein